MIGWFRKFLTHPRWTLSRGLSCLRGRTADPTLCQVPGVDERCTDLALELICDAFRIPETQRYCLRPDDALNFLYLGGFRWRLVDDLEFEHLSLSLDEAAGRQLSVDEFVGIKTVGDVIRFLKKCEQA